jgi:hypothetical protein
MGGAAVRLSAGELAEIDAALPAGRAAGERYPAHSMQAVNR